MGEMVLQKIPARVERWERWYYRRYPEGVREREREMGEVGEMREGERATGKGREMGQMGGEMREGERNTPPSVVGVCVGVWVCGWGCMRVYGCV